MNSDSQEKLRWVGWIFSVLIAPMLGSIFAAPLIHVARGGNTALMISLWIAAISVASIRQSQALARQRGIHGFLPMLGIWLCVTLAGSVVSFAIWFGTCAIISQGGRLLR